MVENLPNKLGFRVSGEFPLLCKLKFIRQSATTFRSVARRREPEIDPLLRNLGLL